MNKHHNVNNGNKDDTLEAYASELLVNLMKSIKSGSINVSTENEEPAMQISSNTNRIHINVLPLFIPDTRHNKKGRIEKFRDKLHTAKEFVRLTEEFAQKLTNNDMTVVLSRKGKEAIILGKEAKPSVSKLASRSDDVQIKSVREVAKLGKDLELGED